MAETLPQTNLSLGIDFNGLYIFTSKKTLATTSFVPNPLQLTFDQTTNLAVLKVTLAKLEYIKFTSYSYTINEKLVFLMSHIVLDKYPATA